jgi:hypothetical protein
MDPQDDYWLHEQMAGEIETALPLVLAGEAADFDIEAVDGVFASVLSRLAPVEAESMGSALRTVGRWAGDRERLGQIASTVLPTAATALGTAYGGPLGGGIGHAVGERAAQAISGRAPRPAATAPPPSAPSAAAPAVTASAATASAAAAPAPAPPAGGGPPPPTTMTPVATVTNGSQAATDLLYLVQNPAFLSSLIALALGSRGRPTVPVGMSGEEAPVGAFVTLAMNLAGKAAEDADALLGDGDNLADSYLRDETGCFTCDPAVPDQRADALLRRLQQADEAVAMLGESEDEDEDSTDDLDDEWWQEQW